MKDNLWQTLSYYYRTFTKELYFKKDLTNAMLEKEFWNNCLKLCCFYLVLVLKNNFSLWITISRVEFVWPVVAWNLLLTNKEEMMFSVLSSPLCSARTYNLHLGLNWVWTRAGFSRVPQQSLMSLNASQSLELRVWDPCPVCSLKWFLTMSA